MRLFRPVTPALLLLLTACADLPEVFPPPPQRKALEGSDFAHLGHYVRMNEISAEAYIVRDISHALESGTWRWTYRRPELRFYLRKTANLKFVLDFAIAETTFHQTGPITLSILVGGRPLGQVHCSKPGPRREVLPVPDQLLQANAVTSVAIEPDKVWVSPHDGAVLGFILVEAGFAE